MQPYNHPSARYPLPGLCPLLLAITVSCTITATADSRSGPLLERVEAGHAALVAAERDYRRNLEAGRLAPMEAADYQHYLSRLRERLGKDCRDLAEIMGRPLSIGPPCAGALAKPPPGFPVDPTEERTSSEEVATLDAQLGAGLSAFDEMLLLEQRRIKASARAGGRIGDGGDGTGSGSGSGSGGSEARGGGSQSPEMATGETGQHSAGARGGAGGPPRAAVRESANRLPDASDDDVVARQLREAAEKEQDPALRERLWEEYRRYKQGDQ